MKSRIKWSDHIKCDETDDAIEHRSHIIAELDGQSWRIESVMASNGRRVIIDETNIYKMFDDIAWDHVSVWRKTPAQLCKMDMKELFISYVLRTP